VRSSSAALAPARLAPTIRNTGLADIAPSPSF